MPSCQDPLGGEAVRTAVDLINMSPSIPLQLDVLEKTWTEKDISYGQLKVFGCRAFVHIPNDERSKLDDKIKQCIFQVVGSNKQKSGSKSRCCCSLKIRQSKTLRKLLRS